MATTMLGHESICSWGSPTANTKNLLFWDITCARLWRSTWWTGQIIVLVRGFVVFWSIYGPVHETFYQIFQFWEDSTMFFPFPYFFISFSFDFKKIHVYFFLLHIELFQYTQWSFFWYTLNFLNTWWTFIRNAKYMLNIFLYKNQCRPGYVSTPTTMHV